MRVVVVDRGGFRRKADGRVSKLPPFGGDGAAPVATGAAMEAAALQRAFLRLRIDLRDLALNCVPELQYSRRPEAAGAEAAARTLCMPATVFGKHLCGACTDFALSCAVNAEAGEPRMRVPCICIATCCHHLAERRHLAAVHLGWSGGDAAATAVAKASRTTHDALLDRMGEHGFDLVASIASWAVSEGGHAPPPPAEDGTVTLAAPSARTITGRKAKQLVDWLRVLYLRGRGFHAELIDGFVGADVSPENAVILAWQAAA
jgi:tRNA:m4X modification enzyme